MSFYLSFEVDGEIVGTFEYNYEGLVILCIVIVGLLSVLLITIFHFSSENMFLPEHLQKYEGLVILCIVIVGLLSVLLASFVLAYVFKWERLMTQIRIQRDNASRKKLNKNGISNDMPLNMEPIKLNT